MDYLFDDVYDPNFDFGFGLESYLDDDFGYAFEMTDDQIRYKTDLRAKTYAKHPGLAISANDPRKLPKRVRNDMTQAAQRTMRTGRGEYVQRAISRNTTHADRVMADRTFERHSTAHAMLRNRARNTIREADKIAARAKSFLGAVAVESFNEGYEDAMIALEGASVDSLKRINDQLRLMASESGSISASDKKRVEAFLNKYEGQTSYIASVIQGGKDSLRNLRTALLIEYCIDLGILIIIGPFTFLLSSFFIFLAMIIQSIIFYVKYNHTQKSMEEARKFSNELKRIASNKKCDSKSSDRLMSMATKLDSISDMRDVNY